MKKILILSIWILASATQLFAISQGDTNHNELYRKEYDKLYNKYKDNPQSIVNIVGMAEFYSSPNNPMKNYNMAITFITDAEKRYLALVNNNSEYKEVNKLIKKKITISSIRKQKQFIIDEVLKYAKGGNVSLPECKEYMNAFASFPAVVEEIKKVESSLAYKECEQINTIKSYASFINEHPNSAEKAQAVDIVVKMVLAEIENAETEEKVNLASIDYTNDVIKKHSEKKKSKIAYSKALKTNTLEGYRSFLSQYPSCDEYMVALDRIEKLLHQDFIHLKTPQQYADFALKNSDSPLSDQAIDTLINMILTDKNIEALDIYLSNFPLDLHYNDVFQSYYRWHTTEGNAAPIEFFAAQYPNYPFSFSLNNDLATGKKIDQMDMLRAFDDSQLNEYHSFIKDFMNYGIAYVALQRIVQKMISKNQWPAAVSRIKSQSICFEDTNAALYNGLIELLNAPIDRKTKITNVFSPKHNVLNAVPNNKFNCLFYTKQHSAGTTHIAYASKDSKGKWVEKDNIPFSNIANENVRIYSFINGTKMLLGKNKDICLAEKDSIGWTVTTIYPYPINSDAFDGDAYMVPDGSGMLLTSDRRGGLNLQPSGSYFHGDTALASDIYFVPQKGNYGWDEIINLGPTINTIFSERSPILSNDLKTLYFVSDGHCGLGYYDIYQSTRTNTNSWTNWSEPKNLGKIYNTGFYEISLSLSEDEKSLYVVSDRGGKFEVHTITLKEDNEEYKKTIKLHSNTILENDATITVVDIDTKKKVDSYSFNGSEMELELFANKNYIVYSLSNEYYSPATLITSDTKNEVQLSYFKINELKSNKIKQPLVSVSYQNTISTDLEATSFYEINSIVDFLNLNQNCNIEIVCNVDIEDLEEAYYLSVERAKLLKEYFISIGIKKDRIITSGYANINYSTQENVYPVELIFR